MRGIIRCFVAIGEEAVRLGRIHAQPIAKKRQVRMTGEVLRQILCSPIGTQMPEHGGAFGKDIRTGCITRFYYDRTATETGGTYSPDTKAVSAAMRRWEQEGVEFCGMIHSHPAGFPQPSAYDLRYAADIIRAMPNTLTEGIMHMPIVTVNTARRTAEIRWYVAVLRADGSVRLECADLIADGRRICGPQQVPVPRRGTRHVIISSATIEKSIDFISSKV